MTDKNPEEIEQKVDPTDKSKEVEKPAGETGFTGQDIDTIGEIGNIFMGAASTTLSTLLKFKVLITTPEVEVFDSLKDLPVAKDECITVEINYTSGLKGKAIFMLKQEDAAAIANIMAGGTGKAEDTELDDAKISAIGEAMNQMVGSASTSLSNMLNMPITITPPEVKLSAKKVAEKELADEKIVSVKFRLTVGDFVDSELYQLITVSSAKTQVEGVTEVMKNMTDDLKDNSSQSIVDDLIKQGESIAAEPFDGQQQYGSTNPQNQVTVQPVQFGSFDNAPNPLGTANQNLNLVMDVSLGLTVELGKAELPIKNVLELTRGSIIELDKVAGEPVELYANGKLIAKGEVVVIEDNFGLRITSIVSPEQRLKNL